MAVVPVSEAQPDILKIWLCYDIIVMIIDVPMELDLRGNQLISKNSRMKGGQPARRIMVKLMEFGGRWEDIKFGGVLSIIFGQPSGQKNDFS